MSKKMRVLVFILAVVLIFLFVLFMLVDAVYVPVKEAIVYPQGELVDSVFVAQNTEYTKNDSLPKTHEFETIPYSVDVPDGNGAKIGTGTVYQLSDSYFGYVSEYTDQYDVQDVISSQFPVALLINYIPEATRITVNVERDGYINGFRGRYIADSLYVTDSAQEKEAMVLGYALDVPEGSYYGNHMFIAVGTTNMDTNAANTCAQVLSAIIKTIRYNSDIDARLTKAREDEKKAQEEAAAAALTEEEVIVDNGDGTITTTVVGDEITETIPIVVPSDYEQFTLQVDWTMNNPGAVLEFFMPDGQSYATPLEQTAYSATFSLSNLPAGTYQLHVMYYQQCGELATTIKGTPAGAEATESTEGASN